VLEVGPGGGVLTRALLDAGATVWGVELDLEWVWALRRAVARETPAGALRPLVMDALDLPWSRLPAPTLVAGNLPYNVATPILARLLESAANGRVLADATVMLQKEVAERVVASSGSPDYGPLALAVALDADAESVLVLPPGAFRPPPKVLSAVVRLRFRPPPVEVGDRAVFTRLVRGAFQQRRKTILNALGPPAATLGREAADLLARAGVDPKIRPGDLSLEGFAALSRAVL